VAELEAQVRNLAEAIAAGALRSSPALASRLAAAETELAAMRVQAVPREVSKLDGVNPRIGDGFRELVEDVPNAVKRDVDRARATVRKYRGNSIRVESDGKTVQFMDQSGRLEAAIMIAAGGAAASQTTVVAGAGFGTYLRRSCATVKSINSMGSTFFSGNRLSYFPHAY
jgi:hypothetical protein